MAIINSQQHDLFGVAILGDPLTDSDPVTHGKKSKKYNADKTSAQSTQSTQTQQNQGFGISTASAQNSQKSGFSVDQNQNADDAIGVNIDDLSEEKDSVIAEHLTARLKPLLCFDDVLGEWLVYSKGLWSVTSKRRATKIISKALGLHLPTGFSMSKLNAMESFLAINLLVEHWESSRNLLPLTNGILDIKKGSLIDYSDKHRFNWQLPFAFDKDAKIDVIADWLNQSTGNDAESIGVIRAFFKMALSGPADGSQKFLELIGEGGTGKSTLVRLLTAFVGERNQVTTDLKNLETNRFEAAGIYGKRLAVINDSSRYGGEVSVLKAITGGDPIRNERKNQQQSGSFVFDGVVVVASNEPIQTADYTSGLIRRRLPVSFSRQVTDDDKARWRSVGGIEAAMLKELPGLLNWALAMTDAELLAVVGSINGSMTQAQREHLVLTNKLAAWLDDNVIIQPGFVVHVGGSQKHKSGSVEIARARRERLYANYEEWCEESSVHPIAVQRFSANLIDVCRQLKIDAKDLGRDSAGKRIKGLAIRSDYHCTKPTPVTRKRLDDVELF